MQARFAKEIGTRAYLRIYWGKGCSPMGCHNAMKHLMESDKLGDWKLGGKPEDYKPEDWGTKCNDCGIPVPENQTNLNYQVHQKRLYDTPSGLLEPGCLYWVTWLPKTNFWDNHEGDYLHAILPNGYPWNIDGRASNCTMPKDRLHRCWRKHGELPNIHVDKNGLTCRTGSSIAVKGYHGFLHNGRFT